MSVNPADVFQFVLTNKEIPPATSMLARIGAMLVVLGMVDVIVRRFTPARWFMLHFIANMFVVGHALPDLMAAFLDPVNSLKGDYSLWPVCWIASIHIYHIIAFSNLTVEDWVHHLVFVGIICPPGLLYPFGPWQNLLAFFLSGLPGGLCYLLLVLQKHKIMDSIQVKIWNARLNVWLRAPGCLLAAGVAFCAARYHPDPNGHPLLLAILSLLTALNGLYYMQEVVLNTGRKAQTYSS